MKSYHWIIIALSSIIIFSFLQKMFQLHYEFPSSGASGDLVDSGAAININVFHLVKVDKTKMAAEHVHFDSPSETGDKKWTVSINGKESKFDDLAAANAFLSKWGIEIRAGLSEKEIRGSYIDRVLSRLTHLFD